MTASNRSAIIAKMHKVLKKHFKPVTVDNNRSVLENLLFACCLENAPYDKALEAFSRVKDSFFDWNEVRVTSVKELAEVVKGLPDPARTGLNMKRTLQSLFEANYSFDLENLRKQNIGKTVATLSKYSGVTGFAVAFVTQNSLGGHSIPIDDAALEVMCIAGVISEEEKEKRIVPGLERAVPKKNGTEFATLLHMVSADLHASPFTSTARSILVEISPDAKSRLPKRGSHGKPKAAKTKVIAKKVPAKSNPTSTAKKKKPKPVAKQKPTQRSKGESAGRKKTTAKKKSATSRLAKQKPR